MLINVNFDAMSTSVKCG